MKKKKKKFEQTSQTVFWWVTPNALDLDILLEYCRRHPDDDKCVQFYKHTSPKVKRGGGGWLGSVKATLKLIEKVIGEIK